MTKIIVAGGVGRVEVEIIDLDSSSTACSRIANLPVANYGSVGILGPNQQPLICGGYTSGYSNVCYILESGQWQVTNEMNEKRVHAAISPSPYPSNDFSAFVTGGIYGSGLELDSGEVWNQNVWTLSPKKMPHGISYHCMVQINLTTVMIIGGANSGYLRETYLFNSETENWTSGPHLEEARGYHACARINADNNSPFYSIIAAGGYNGTLMSSVEILDDVNGNWRYGPPLPVPLYGGTLVEDPAGGVIFIGGQNDAGTHDTLYRLSHAGPNSSWMKLPQKLQSPRGLHVSFLVPDEIVNCTLV